MKHLICLVMLMMLVMSFPAHAGDSIGLKFEVKIRQGSGFESPSLQIGKGKVQYRFSSHKKSELELDKFRWSYKYPSDLYHEDDIIDLDIESFRRYNDLND